MQAGSSGRIVIKIDGEIASLWSSLSQTEKRMLAKVFKEVVVAYAKYGDALPLNVKSFKELIDLAIKQYELVREKLKSVEEEKHILESKLSEASNELKRYREAIELQKKLAKDTEERYAKEIQQLKEQVRKLSDTVRSRTELIKRALCKDIDMLQVSQSDRLDIELICRLQNQQQQSI